MSRKPWEHPGGRALKDGDLGDVVGNRRQHLGGARARPDDGDAPAFEIEAVRPFRRVEDRPLEALQAFDIGVLRTMQAAEPAHHQVRRNAAAVLRRHGPARAVEHDIAHLRAEANMRA